MEAFRTAPGDAREDFRWRPDPGEGPQTPDTTVSNDGVPQHCVGVLSHLRQLLLSESFVDVTLCCLGGSLRAHRVLLSACSPYLQRLLLDHPSADHTTIILADVQRDDMGALLQFIYTGSVSVPRERLGSFLLTAEALQVKVLKDMPCMPGSGGHLPVDVKVSVGDETSSPGGSLRQPCCPPPPSAMDPSTSAPAAFDSASSATTGKQPPSRGQALGCGLLPSLAGPERGYLHDMPLPPHLQPPPPSLLSTHLPTHLPGLPPHLAFAPPLGLHPGLPSGLPLPPPELWSRPLHGLPPSLPPPVPLAPSPTSAQSSSFPDGWPPDRAKAEREERADRTDSPEPHAGAQTGAQAGLRPAMTSIVTPSPWLQSRRPPMRPGARTPIRPHASRLQAPPPPPSPSLSPTAVRPAPLSPAAPPAKPTPSREALPRPTTPRRASVVPKKRMSPGAEAYCFREQLGSTTSMTPPPGASSASSAGSALNLCVPKTSPAASPVLQQALEAAPPPLSPMTPSAAAATATSCKPAPAFHDPNNNHTGTGHGLGCAAPAGPAMPHRPIATRPDPGAFLANGFLAAPTPLPGLPPLPGLDAGETTIKCEVVELDTVAELPADAAVKEEESDGGASPAKAHCCEVCGKRFSRRQLLVQHRRVHTGERPYTCGACGKQFSQRGHWSTHQKLHEPTRAAEHTCESCGKAFVTKASLKVHMRTHTGEKPFRCAECGKTFSQLRNFKYHRSVHEGTREFAATCPECGKLFNDRGYLSSHMKIHRNRKEYGCEFCGKSFNQRVAYNMHVRIHTGEKPHQCPTCGKTFSRKMLLKQHLRIHTGEKPFSCTVCGKCFADRSNMTLHMRLHSGEKPYQCTVCCKSFTKKHHLKTHINYHTGLKPYSCSKCGLSFSQSSNMRTHQKKCNGPPPGGIVPAAVPAVPSPSGGGVTVPTGSPSPLRPLTPAVGPTSQAEPAAPTPAEGKAVLGRPLRLTPSPTASEASSRHLVISPEQQVRLAPAMEAPTC